MKICMQARTTRLAHMRLVDTCVGMEEGFDLLTRSLMHQYNTYSAASIVQRCLIGSCIAFDPMLLPQKSFCSRYSLLSPTPSLLSACFGSIASLVEFPTAVGTVSGIHQCIPEYYFFPCQSIAFLRSNSGGVDTISCRFVCFAASLFSSARGSFV